MKTPLLLLLLFIISLCGSAVTIAQTKTLGGSPYVIAMVGDSITFDGGDENQYAWLHKLRNNLGEGFVIHNFGVNGATALKKSNTPYWLQSEFKAALDSKPDAVFIMLGTNDSKADHWQQGTNNFEKDYNNLIAKFANLPTKPKIWLGLNLPAFSDGWTINADVIANEILPIVKRIANNNQIAIIDLNTPFKNKPSLFSDGIHPNWQGGNVLAELLTNTILAHCQVVSCSPSLKEEK